MKEQAEIQGGAGRDLAGQVHNFPGFGSGRGHDVSLYDEAFERLLLGEEKFPPPPDTDDVVVVGGLSANDPTAEEAQADERRITKGPRVEPLL